MSEQDNNALCSRDRCPNKRLCRGLCAKHYRQCRAERVARGTWRPGFVDPKRAHEHVEALRGKGLSLSRIGTLSGVHPHRLAKLPRCTRIAANTEAKVIAVPMPAAAHQVATPGFRVPSTGITRRLRGLVALGHPQRAIADRVGMLENNLAALVTGRQVMLSAANARRIIAVFDQMQFEPGTSQRARNRARAKGYVNAWAWDIDTIDDPDACPHRTTQLVLAPTRGRLIPDDFAEIVAEHRELGRTDDDIAERLGLKLDTLQSRLRRLEARAS